MRTAFEQGLDIHTATAERMFGVHMGGPAGLAALDRSRYEEFRTKAKRINFGILYGQRGAGLSRGLTDAGVPTSRGEADELIAAYLGAYPGIAKWVEERDKFIGHFAATKLDAGWPLTLRLHALWPRTDSARRALRAHQARHHSAEEVHRQMLHAEQSAAPGHGIGDVHLLGHADVDVAEVAWALSFAAPVVVRRDGSPQSFASHTPAGRRQQFTFSVDWVLGEAAAVVGCSAKPRPAAVWRSVLRPLRASAASCPFRRPNATRRRKAARTTAPSARCRRRSRGNDGRCRPGVPTEPGLAHPASARWPTPTATPPSRAASRT